MIPKNKYREEAKLNTNAISNLCIDSGSFCHFFTIVTSLRFSNIYSVNSNPNRRQVSAMIQSRWRRLFIEKKVSRFLVPSHWIHVAVYGMLRKPGTMRARADREAFNRSQLTATLLQFRVTCPSNATTEWHEDKTNPLNELVNRHVIKKFVRSNCKQFARNQLINPSRICLIIPISSPAKCVQGFTLTTALFHSQWLANRVSHSQHQWASCQIRKFAGAHAPGMPGTFSPSPQVSDPDMHHGTCVTHVPWCMPGSLTSGFLWNRRRGKTFPAFPAHARPAILRIW